MTSYLKNNAKWMVESEGSLRWFYRDGSEYHVKGKITFIATRNGQYAIAYDGDLTLNRKRDQYIKASITLPDGDWTPIPWKLITPSGTTGRSLLVIFQQERYLKRIQFSSAIDKNGSDNGGKAFKEAILKAIKER